MSGLVRSLLRARQVDKSPLGDYWYQVPGQESDAGVDVDPNTALSSTAVLCAIRHFGQLIGQLPIDLYKYLDSDQDGRERDRAHELYEVLRWQPNPLQTSIEWRERMQGSALLHGNAYAEIEFDNRMRVKALWQLGSHRVRLHYKDGKLLYIFTVDGRDEPLEPWRVFHLPGFSVQGICGMDPVKTCLNAIGLTLAQEKYGAKFFANGCTVSGVLEHPTELSDTAYDRLEKRMAARFGGLDNAHRMLIFEEGSKWHATGVSPTEAQLLQGRQFQLGEVARIFNIAPQFLYELSKATYNSLEQLDLGHLKYSVAPWLERWVQRIRMSLFSQQDRQSHFVEFNVDSMLRTDLKSRYEAHNMAINGGWGTRNEARRFENRNPLPGLDEPTIPMNVGVTGGNPNSGAPGAEQIGGGEDDEDEDKTDA